MNILYVFPFVYFYRTRLRHGSLAFHALFEWIAAIVLVVVLGRFGAFQSIVYALLTYLAFVSIYEIGYIANDLFASSREIDGRKRGPQAASAAWVLSWILVRLLVFGALTVALEKESDNAWWGFFLALGSVFAVHNLLQDREFKAATFIWLAWFRFMAPVVFIVEGRFLMGIGLAASMGYASFRLLGYLDSKSLLIMPGRQRMGFRAFFFLMPLAGVGALFPYPEARGFVLLASYFASITLIGVVSSKLRFVPLR